MALDVQAARLERAAHRQRWPLVVAACVVAVLAVGIPGTIWFAHWRSSLNELVAYPAFGDSTPVPAGATIYFGGNLVATRVIAHPNDSTPLSVHVDSIRPAIRENTAGARVVVLRCVLRSVGGPVLAADRTAVDDKCSSLIPFGSGALRVGFLKGDDDIVIAVTPQHAGVVRVIGVEVHYSSGLRHGVAHTGGSLTTTTR